MSHRTVIILGSRGIPAKHGGFETFVQNLVPYLVSQSLKTVVYCQNDQETQATYSDQWQGVDRVHISPGKRSRILKGLPSILFDIRATIHALINYRKAVWLVLGYNTAFLNIIPAFLGIKQIINMDGIEWKRDKWSRLAKIYLYWNYQIAGRVGSVLIGDHPEIEKMLRDDFPKQDITMIPYGSHKIQQADKKALQDYGIGKDYLLLIARLEPENNILPIIRAWSQKRRSCKLVIVGNYLSDNVYLNKVRKAASKDVIFTGPIYDRKIVETLRYHCKAYLHGHQVGGTNPTLVESLGTGCAIIAHDNPFNRWVAGKSGVYFSSETQLTDIFDQIENNKIDLEYLKQEAVSQHKQYFEWEPVLKSYKDLIESQF